MNTTDNNTNGRRCILLSFANKRSADFSAEEEVGVKCASIGYYFEKTDRVAYDNSREIVRAIKDAASHFENIFLLYPVEMDGTVKGFVADLLGAKFDGLGVLQSGNITVFALFSDSRGKLGFDDIKAVLDKKYSTSYDRTVIRFVGAPVALIDEAASCANAALHASAADDAYLNITESYGDYRLEIVYNSTAPKMAVDGAVREILLRLDNYVYATEDIPLAEQLFRLLRLRRMKISVAESFTGGGVCKRLVEVPGVSEVFFEGMNTYSNQSKSARLGVGENTLRQHGAVSAETAAEMAQGLLSTGCCNLAVATTGIAGPKSDNTQKPVGLAYIAVGTDEGGIHVAKFNFTGERRQITETAINQALFLAFKELK